MKKMLRKIINGTMGFVMIPYALDKLHRMQEEEKLRKIIREEVKECLKSNQANHSQKTKTT